ncbi:MAG: P-loop NTPase [Candidatus Aenigmatarchaeota archaeon]|jgi:MinD-like ATPase involved in chromosome partitioning or flagellar assembly
MTKSIGVISGKGGTGKTIFSINLSIALNQLGKKTVLIDGNITMPHVAQYLGIENFNFTLNDVLKEKVNILNAFYNFNGIKILPSSTKIEDLKDVDIKKLKRNVEILKKSGNIDFIIIDGAPGIGKEALAIIEASDDIILVTNPFDQMIEDVLKLKEILSYFGNKKAHLVLNMGFWPSKSKIEEIEQKTKMKVLGIIPTDKKIQKSLINRIPLMEYSKKSITAECFRIIASKISEEEYNQSLKFKIFSQIMELKNKLEYIL